MTIRAPMAIEAQSALFPIFRYQPAKEFRSRFDVRGWVQWVFEAKELVAKLHHPSSPRYWIYSIRLKPALAPCYCER